LHLSLETIVFNEKCEYLGLYEFLNKVVVIFTIILFKSLFDLDNIDLARLEIDLLHPFDHQLIQKLFQLLANQLTLDQFFMFGLINQNIISLGFVFAV